MKEMNMNELEQVNGGDGLLDFLEKKVKEAIEAFRRKKEQLQPKA